MQEHEQEISYVELVRQAVARLYEQSESSFALWMLRSHQPALQKQIKAICAEYGINYQRTTIAGWLHDLGDAFGADRDSSLFDQYSLEEARKLLKTLGVPPAEIDYIVEKVIATHSCRPGKMPVVPEAKALAAADAMAHFFSDFYAKRPRLVFFDNYEREKWIGYKKWAYEKVRHDYYVKLQYFPELQKMAKKRFEELLRRYR